MMVESGHFHLSADINVSDNGSSSVYAVVLVTLLLS